MNEPCLPCKPVIPELRVINLIERKVRSMIIDYALLALILGVIPVYGSWVPAVRIACLIFINVRMVLAVGRFWGHHKGHFVMTNITLILAILRSFFLAILIWAVVVMIGLIIPFVDSLARAIAYSFLTMSIGSSLSHYYYRPGVLDGEALGRAMNFHQLQFSQINLEIRL